MIADAKDPSAYRFGPRREWRIYVAATKELREKAFRLIYEVYSRSGYRLRIRHESGLWCTIHQLHPGTVIFLAQREETPVGSVTVIPDTGLGLPTDRIFPEPLADLRRAGRRLCEVSSFAVTEEPSGSPLQLTLHLYRLAHLTSLHLMNRTDIVASVMAHHGKFYSRFLLFDEVSPEPRVSPKTGQRVCYARLNLETMAARYQERYAGAKGWRNLYRWFFQNEEEPSILDWLRRSRQAMNREELHYFGAVKTDILAEAGQDMIAVLDEDYGKAWGPSDGKEFSGCGNSS